MDLGTLKDIMKEVRARKRTYSASNSRYAVLDELEAWLRSKLIDASDDRRAVPSYSRTSIGPLEEELRQQLIESTK